MMMVVGSSPALLAPPVRPNHRQSQSDSNIGACAYLFTYNLCWTTSLTIFSSLCCFSLAVGEQSPAAARPQTQSHAFANAYAHAHAHASGSSIGPPPPPSINKRPPLRKMSSSGSLDEKPPAHTPLLSPTSTRPGRSHTVFITPPAASAAAPTPPSLKGGSSRGTQQRATYAMSPPPRSTTTAALVSPAAAPQPSQRQQSPVVSRSSTTHSAGAPPVNVLPLPARPSQSKPPPAFNRSVS